MYEIDSADRLLVFLKINAIALEKNINREIFLKI